MGMRCSDGIVRQGNQPANVMITTGGEVKLLDFGLARFIEHPPQEHHYAETTAAMSLDEVQKAELDKSAIDERSTHLVRVSIGDEPVPAQTRLTRVGTLIGTPLFMAPELWLGQMATASSDVYAFGLLMYELLAGKLPHADLGLAELALFVSSYDLPSLAEELPEIPRQFSTLVDRCIKRDMQARPTMELVRTELEGMVSVFLPFSSQSEEQISGDVARVSASFLRISRQGTLLAERFYERFFALEPPLRELFPIDMATQARMLTTALKLTLENLQQPDRLLPFISELGRRHAHYGVQPRHLGLMGRALLEVLPSVDPEWTDSTGHAWAKAYGHIAQQFQRGIESVRASQPLPLGSIGRAHWEVPLFAPQTSWVIRPDGDLAYQCFGHGAIDVVVVWEWISNIEQIWHSPRVATFFRHLASMARVILFDRRGCGLSSASGATSEPDQQVRDILSIMEHAGVDRAVILGMGDGCIPACLLSATRPERTRALVLYGYGKCLAQRAPHQAGGQPASSLLADQCEMIRKDWGGPLFVETLAPSLAKDASYRRWWAACLRQSASPSEAAALFQWGESQSVKAVLGSLRIPTLVLHRESDSHRSVQESEQLAKQIRNAQLAILPGADHVPWAGDTDAVLGALHSFLSGLPSLPISASVAGCVIAVSAMGAQISPLLRELVRRELILVGAGTVDTHLEHVLLAYFDGPGRAVQCAQSMVAAAERQDLAMSVGIDLGSLLLLPNLGGEAVDQAIALAMAAPPCAILLSDAVRTLTVGPDLVFSEHVIAAEGEAARIVYSVEPAASKRPPQVRTVVA